MRIAVLACLALVTPALAAPQHKERFPLGLLGGVGVVTAGSATVEVVAVHERGPGARAGLRVGDHIVAVGGMLFAEHTAKVDDGGSGPQRALGHAIDRAGDRERDTDRVLRLTIERDSSRQKLEITLPPRPGLGGARRARARRDLRAAAAEQLLGTQHENGMWNSPVGLTGDRVLSAWALLALIAHADPAHREAIDRGARWLRGPDQEAWLPDDLTKKGPDNLDNWALAATSIALAEHRLATVDQADLAVIARCNAALAARMDAAGRFGHDVTVGYSGKGFNVINAQAQLAWALGAQAGAELPATAWRKSFDQLAASVDTNGGVRYWTIANTGTGDASLRTGAFALALHVSGKAPDLCAKLVQYLDTHAARAREAHAVGSLGMLVQAPALRARDAVAYERFLEEWRWYLVLTRGPDNRLTYIGGKRNNGGDSYLGFDQIACVIALQLLACGDDNLRMTHASVNSSR